MRESIDVGGSALWLQLGKPRPNNGSFKPQMLVPKRACVAARAVKPPGGFKQPRGRSAWSCGIKWSRCCSDDAWACQSLSTPYGVKHGRAALGSTHTGTMAQRAPAQDASMDATRWHWVPGGAF